MKKSQFTDSHLSLKYIYQVIGRPKDRVLKKQIEVLSIKFEKKKLFKDYNTDNNVVKTALRASKSTS